ncbi:MAG TPA: efflux RND transporter periplasmic adaptor subunit [Bacteroidota bacterium]|jgi:RND family efflux transporter MFP subunit|nr:efflux RND transporter periplasmic adaptor subunit [Bacteroidota bacterium]
MKKSTIGIIAVGLLLLAAVAWKIVGTAGTGDTRRQNSPLVQVEPPVQQTIVNTLRFNGDVLPIKQANIFSKVNGNLEHIYSDMGAFVHENQTLALIDTTVLAQTFQEKSATYTNTTLAFNRANELFGKNLISKQEYDNSEAAMKVAKATYESAKTQLDYSRIIAPFTGYVTKRYLDPGALVTSNNSTLFTLMDLESMKIIINVLEKDIPSITIGKKAVITVDAFPQKEFTGTITRYSQAIDLSTRTMAVEIDIPNTDHQLKPGMFANVTVIVNEKPNALTVPTTSLLKDDKGSFIYVVDSSKARRRNITLGVEQNGRTEIVSGIRGGEKLVTTGQQFVRDGGQVTIQQ